MAKEKQVIIKHRDGRPLNEEELVLYNKVWQDMEDCFNNANKKKKSSKKK